MGVKKEQVRSGKHIHIGARLSDVHTLCEFDFGNQDGTTITLDNDWLRIGNESCYFAGVPAVDFLNSLANSIESAVLPPKKECRLSIETTGTNSGHDGGFNATEKLTTSAKVAIVQRKLFGPDTPICCIMTDTGDCWFQVCNVKAFLKLAFTFQPKSFHCRRL